MDASHSIDWHDLLIAYVDGGGQASHFDDELLCDAFAHAEASRVRQEKETERAAWIIAAVYNAAGAKPLVTVDKILGRKSRKVDVNRNEEALDAMLSVMASPPVRGQDPAKRIGEAQLAAFRAQMRATTEALQASKGGKK